MIWCTNGQSYVPRERPLEPPDCWRNLVKEDENDEIEDTDDEIEEDEE